MNLGKRLWLGSATWNSVNSLLSLSWSSDPKPSLLPGTCPEAGTHLTHLQGLPEEAEGEEGPQGSPTMTGAPRGAQH